VRRLASILIAATLFAGCAAETVKRTSLPEAAGLDTDLQRGVSTKAEVLLLLGDPDGAGEFGGFHEIRGIEDAASGPADLWYYEANRASMAGAMTESIKVLLVFFRDDVYEGYYWFGIDASGDWSTYN